MKIRVNTQTYDLHHFSDIGTNISGEMCIQFDFDTKPDDVSKMIQIFSELDGVIDILTDDTFELIKRYTSLTQVLSYTYSNGILSVILREANFPERIRELERKVTILEDRLNGYGK